MNKKILAGTMAMVLMAGQFSTMAFADSKDKKDVIKAVPLNTKMVKAMMVKAFDSKTNASILGTQGQMLTEKELEELLKNTKGLVLGKSNMDGLSASENIKATKLTPAIAITNATDSIEIIPLTSSMEAIPATKTVSATKK